MSNAQPRTIPLRAAAAPLPLPDPPSIEHFPPAVWPPPEHRREATIRSARAAGVSDADIALAGGCGSPPLYFWGALVVLLVLVVYIVYVLVRTGGGKAGGVDLRRSDIETGESVDCTNWESAASSVREALPWCGKDSPPHFLHGRLVAFGPGGEPCHTETLTGELIDSETVNAMTRTAYDSCGAHPNAYLSTGAYTCSPPGAKSMGGISSCGTSGRSVRGTTASPGSGKFVGGSPTEPTRGSRRRGDSGR